MSRYDEAIDALTEVIKLAPNLADPYHTLGLLYEAIGRSRKALDFYMIAAHLTPKEATLWKRLASLSSDLGFFRQAIYCLTKVLPQKLHSYHSSGHLGRPCPNAAASQNACLCSSK